MEDINLIIYIIMHSQMCGCIWLGRCSIGSRRLVYRFILIYIQGLWFNEGIYIHRLPLRQLVFYWEAVFFSCFGLGSERKGYEVYFRGKWYYWTAIICFYRWDDKHWAMWLGLAWKALPLIIKIRWCCDKQRDIFASFLFIASFYCHQEVKVLLQRS